MKNWLWTRVLAAAIALSALSSATRADNDKCSNATLKGDYGFTVHGEQVGIVTAAGPQFFPVPVPIDGVAMTYFDGKGNLTQVDFVMQDGRKRPGATDPTTGFDGNQTGSYTVFPDCTGNFEIDPPPRLNPVHNGTFIAAKFVLANQGREIHTVVNQLHVANHIPVGGVSCDIPTGCDVLPQVRSDGTKLQHGQGNDD
jgi:hypothetical protein